MRGAENATETNIKETVVVAGLLPIISSQFKKETVFNGCSPARVPEEIPALGVIQMIEEMIADKGEERENAEEKEKAKERAKAKAKEKAKAKAMVKQLNGELLRQPPEGSHLQEGTIALFAVIS